ncbi:MAG TPA: hypothetical protein DCR14_06925 [Acidimicrobiaceae bacterium]|nr:hypothetical protein [Acidimicrobiaceae bacterium]
MNHSRHIGRAKAAAHADRGAVDVSIQMLFGAVAVIMVMLLVFEATAYWHARNVYDEAATEGVRVAAAFDGSCAEGQAAARRVIERMASGWTDRVEVQCKAGATVTVIIRGRTPGVLGRGLGTWVTVVESAPKER